MRCKVYALDGPLTGSARSDRSDQAAFIASVQKGGEALDPGESVNRTIGALLNVGDLDVTVDYAAIEVTVRIVADEDTTPGVRVQGRCGRTRARRT